MTEGTPPKALALDVTHDTVVEVLKANGVKGRVLDCGAGRGALSWRLAHRTEGITPFACDLYPEQFEVKGIECRRVDINKGLPFDNGEFDAVCSVEVAEHLENRFDYFREINRVLKPGGILILTTPNITNLASRLRFLFSGFYSLFKPLDEGFGNPLHDHITPLPWYYYRYSLSHSGYEVISVGVDRIRSSAVMLMWLWPVAWLYTRFSLGKEKNPDLRSSNRALAGQLLRADLMCGRTVIIAARKVREAASGASPDYGSVI
jgi:SAM-dependent methyltransferase